MITRRGLLSAAAAGITTMAAGPAHAQGSYPDKLIKMYVPAPPGGQTDVLARLLAQKIQAAVGQNVIIDNRPGAGGAIGARALAAAEPDGYSLFYGNTSTLAVIPAVSKNPGYDPVKNFAPIASVSDSYMILVVHPAFPAKSVQELVAYAKANPGKLNFGHAGAGNVTHLTGEMFRSLAKIDFLGVPHRGGAESITALLGEQVHFLFESPVVLLPLIHEGKLRALGVTSATRKPEASDSSDHGGSRRSRIRGDAVDRDRGASGHADPHRRQAQRRDQREPEDRRDDGDSGQVRITTADRLAARVCDVPRRRDPQMG